LYKLLLLLLFPLFFTSISLFASISGSNPVNTIYDALQRCGKRVEKATKQAEIMADNFWNHSELSLSVIKRDFLFLFFQEIISFSVMIMEIDEMCISIGNLDKNWYKFDLNRLR